MNIYQHLPEQNHPVMFQIHVPNINHIYGKIKNWCSKPPTRFHLLFGFPVFCRPTSSSGPLCHGLAMVYGGRSTVRRGFQLAMGAPNNVWLIRENPYRSKWMMTGGSPILGHLHSPYTLYPIFEWYLLIFDVLSWALAVGWHAIVWSLDKYPKSRLKYSKTQ